MARPALLALALAAALPLAGASCSVFPGATSDATATSDPLAVHTDVLLISVDSLRLRSRSATLSSPARRRRSAPSASRSSTRPSATRSWPSPKRSGPRRPLTPTTGSAHAGRALVAQLLANDPAATPASASETFYREGYDAAAMRHVAFALGADPLTLQFAPVAAHAFDVPTLQVAYRDLGAFLRSDGPVARIRQTGVARASDG